MILFQIFNILQTTKILAPNQKYSLQIYNMLALIHYNLDGLVVIIKQRETLMALSEFQLWSSFINNISSGRGRGGEAKS